LNNRTKIFAVAVATLCCSTWQPDAAGSEIVSLDEANRLLSFNLTNLDLSNASDLVIAKNTIIARTDSLQAADTLSRHKFKIRDLLELLSIIEKLQVADFDFSQKPLISLPNTSIPNSKENLEAIAFSRLYSFQFDLRRIRRSVLVYMERHQRHYLSDDERTRLIDELKAWSSTKGVSITDDAWRAISGESRVDDSK